MGYEAHLLERDANVVGVRAGGRLPYFTVSSATVNDGSADAVAPWASELGRRAKAMEDGREPKKEQERLKIQAKNMRTRSFPRRLATLASCHDV